METTFFRLEEPNNFNSLSFHQKTNYVTLFRLENSTKICFRAAFYFNLKNKTDQQTVNQTK